MGDEIQMDDILAAMAECLIETNTMFEVPSSNDRTTNLLIGGKPPKEVFYRNTATFFPNVPEAIKLRRCTCVYLCTGAPATKKCLSCALYDPAGVGYFCDACFKCRHPWYRVSHVSFDIEEDENIEYTMQIADKRAQAFRYEWDGKNMMNQLQDNKQKLAIVGDDFKVDEDLRFVGRKMIGLEETIKNIRKNLREDVRESGIALGVKMTRDEAASYLQRIYKGHRTRNFISLHYLTRIVKIWDNHTSRELYYDTKTGKASFEAPKLLKKKHWENVNFHEEVKEVLKWFCKRNINRKREKEITKKNIATQVIRGFMRCIQARIRIVAKGKDVYRRIYDHDSFTYYYGNTLNGSTTWIKPCFFLIHEPPLLVPEGEAKRSPRSNRVHTKALI